MNLRTARMLGALLLSPLTAPAFATSDAETPEQVLDMVRLFMSHPTIAADVAAIAEQGCVWSSEVVWFGSPTEASESVFVGGGGFTIFYAGTSGEERPRAYTWSGTWGSDREITLTDVRRPASSAREFDCT